MTLNRAQLIGHVGQDPEIKTMPNGTKLAKCSLATNKKWTDKAGEKQEKTEWHNLVFWDKKAETVEKFVKKGSRIYVEGEIETQEYEGKKYVQIIVSNLGLL